VPLPSHPDKLYLERQQGREQTAPKSEPIERCSGEEQAAGGQVAQLGLRLCSPHALIRVARALVHTAGHSATRTVYF